MRKLIRKNNLKDYQNMLNAKGYSALISKTLMSSKIIADNDYTRLSSEDWFRDFIINVENNYCPYCEANRLVKGPGNFQIDHIKDKSKHKKIAIAWNNLVPSCSRCNLLKGAKTNVLNPLKNDYSNVFFEFIPSIEDFTEIKIVTKDLASAESLQQLQLENFYNTMIEEIKVKIKDIKTINLSKNNSNEYIGYNNIFGRLLKCYDDKIGF